MNVRECYQEIAHAVDTLSSQISAISLVNDAGSALVAMHGWRWCMRPPAVVAEVGGQSFLSLPSDFGTWLGMRYRDRSRRFAKSTMAIVEDWRTSGQTESTITYGAIVHAPDSRGIPQPQIEIWPTPPADDASALRMLYSARWVPVSNDEDFVPIPEWFPESLFKALLRAHAEGYEKGDIAGVNARVAALKAGPLFTMAEEQDRIMSPDYGSMMQADELLLTPWWDVPVMDPS